MPFEDSSSPSLSVKAAIQQILNVQREHPATFRIHQAKGSLPALLVAKISEVLAPSQKPLVVVTPDESQALAFVRNLQFFLGSSSAITDGIHLSSLVMHLPEEEQSPWAETSSNARSVMQRMSVLFRLSQGQSGSVLVASAAAISRKVIPKQTFVGLVDVLQAGEETDRDKTIALLQRTGYQRMPICEDPGTFAVHGGILDVFVPLYPYPVRLELFGDLLESIRFYDPATQRTLRPVSEVLIHPVRETVLTSQNFLRQRLLEVGDQVQHPSSRTREILEQIERGEDFLGMETLTPAFHASMVSLAEYLPTETTFFVQDPHLVLDALVQQERDSQHAYQQKVAENRLAFPPQDFYLTSTECENLWKQKNSTSLETAGLELVEKQEKPNYDVHFSSQSHQGLIRDLRRAQHEKQEHLLLPWANRLKEQHQSNVHTVVVAGNLQHAERVESLLKIYGLSTHIHRPGVAALAAAQQTDQTLKSFDILQGGDSQVVDIRLGTLSQGFDLPSDGVALYSEAEIFGERVARASVKSRKKPSTGDFKDVVIGSFVVHQKHGVGRYLGLAQLPLQGVQVDFVHLQYEGGMLYLPVWRLNELQRYVGAEGATPRLDKLGGETWQKTKTKVSKEIQKLAEELLRLYAQRQALPGFAQRLDADASQTFAEFEATFPYQETPDQQRAIDEVLVDLEEPRPMDRLVCGDVGYGKTEVAVRATMKSILAGKQVAVLAPTTVLVEQHAARFSERFSGFPVNVASLSRFRSRTEQTQTLKELAEGRIDVVVGTHRLLSADVRFKDLGLLVIDEEQRFGVAHKERLRQLRSHVDTLTLTATPIPRTLHMAFSGLREISIISTPPEDRLAIRTLVARESGELIREGIQNELRRGGQVYFVHNRIETIGKWARRLHELLPDLRIVVGHGQMSPEQLEQVMLDFVQGRADVLLCTTIIESGLDIPRANTMFVDRADTFGLSQLYQLRGRIGRSKERAYCYLLVPPAESMTRDAKQRLAVLQRFTELGSGFHIASHDLEIRGAGELLGDKQSGTISAVGFDMYTQMLQEAVAGLKGQQIADAKDPELTCDVPGFIPEGYLPDVSQRMDLYKRFSGAQNEEEIERLCGELRDRYGDPPEEVGILADIMVVKSLGRRLGALAVELSQTRLALALSENTPLQPMQVLQLANQPKSLWRLTPDMRLVRNFVGEAEKQDRLAVAKTWLADLLTKAVG